ncbi:MAG: hypothetical protein PHZ00_01390 [Candidatus Peribacteraceae bacterium]|nr:hypothetical protein [Candidatus Peribacteraceae bacterium]
MQETSETHATIPEYSFDDGLVETFRRIHIFLQEQDIVIVVISGFDNQNDSSIGKSSFRNHLIQLFNHLHIPSAQADSLDCFNANAAEVFAKERQQSDSKKGVIILGAELIIGTREAMDRKISKKLRPLRIPFPKMDIGILMRRPDQAKKVTKDQPADMIIINEKAVRSENRADADRAGTVSEKVLEEIGKLFQATQ